MNNKYNKEGHQMTFEASNTTTNYVSESWNASTCDHHDRWVWLSSS